MPTFETLMMGAPIGFTKACSSLSLLAAENPEEYSALLTTTFKSFKSGVAVPTEQFNEEEKCLYYILKARSQSSIKPSPSEMASVLDSNTVLSRESIVAFVSALETSDSDSSTQSISQLTAGQLLDFKWRLGVSIASSNCKNLATPYVAISYAVKDANGKVLYQNAELSYSEFQDFCDTFRQVARVMDDM